LKFEAIGPSLDFKEFVGLCFVCFVRCVRVCLFDGLFACVVCLCGCLFICFLLFILLVGGLVVCVYVCVFFSILGHILVS